MKIWCYILFVYPLISSAAPSKLALCISCHGKDGIALQKSWPNLNGQSQNYIFKQLNDYKFDKRISPIMQPYAKILTAKEMAELAQFYATLPSKTSITSQRNHLYQNGNSKKRIPACSACHGPNGMGNDFAKFPKISGQNILYLKEQLRAFKNHSRNNDSYHIMQDIAARMSKKDIQNISHYLNK